VSFGSNFIPFGCGPHACLGQRYALNHMALFISLLATKAKFVRKQTANMHDIDYFPTLVPADGCVLTSIEPLG
jgi:cytochrome P450 family 710 subfamily A protein